MLDGLAVVHDNAVLHRDLKPGNIILRRDGTPVLIDFGAARDFAARHSRSVTAVATPGYAPPEQFGIGGQQGPWTDFYVLGAILYRCVTGAEPVDSLRRLRKDPLVPVSVAAAGRYDPVLLDVIDRMLAVNEEDRPASVESVQDLLSEGCPSPTRDFEIPRAPQHGRVFAAPSLRRRTVIAGSAAALALIIAVLGVSLTTGEWGELPALFPGAPAPNPSQPASKVSLEQKSQYAGQPEAQNQSGCPVINGSFLLETYEGGSVRTNPMTITTYREGERLSYNWNLGTDYHFPDGAWRPYREARRGGYSRFECQSGRLRQEVQFSSAGSRIWFRLIQPIRREGLYIETDIPRESGLYRRQ